MKLKNICSTVQEFFIGILYIIKDAYCSAFKSIGLFDPNMKDSVILFSIALILSGTMVTAAILIFTAIAIGVISLGIYALIKFSDILWPFYVFFGVVCLVRFIYIKLREKSKNGKISIWSNLFVNTK